MGPIKYYCIRWFAIGEVSKLAEEYDLGPMLEGVVIVLLPLIFPGMICNVQLIIAPGKLT